MLVPTWVAFAVAQLLEAHLPNLVDYHFTAQMEDDLDAISRGEAGTSTICATSTSATARPGLKQQLAEQGRTRSTPATSAAC